VNRHTVRRAIAALAEKGLVSVRQGRGTFICKEVTDVPVSGRSRLRVDVNGQSRAPAGRVLAAAEGAAPAAVAHALGLAEGDPVVIVRALGEAEGRPVSLADHSYSARRFPGIIDACRRGGSIVQVLAAAGITEGRRRLTRVGARLPDPEEAHLLAQPVDRPILICESVDVGADVPLGPIAQQQGLHPRTAAQVEHRRAVLLRHERREGQRGSTQPHDVVAGQWGVGAVVAGQPPVATVDLERLDPHHRLDPVRQDPDHAERRELPQHLRRGRCRVDGHGPSMQQQVGETGDLAAWGPQHDGAGGSVGKRVPRRQAEQVADRRGGVARVAQCDQASAAATGSRSASGESLTAIGRRLLIQIATTITTTAMPAMT